MKSINDIEDAITAIKDGWVRTALEILEEARLEARAVKQLRDGGIYPPGTQEASAEGSYNPVLGKFCIARCYSAGVHAGTVVSVHGETVVLKDSRRLWSWKAKDGVALSGVAQSGLTADKSKVDVMNPTIYLTGVCELIPCSDKAKESINEA